MNKCNSSNVSRPIYLYMFTGYLIIENGNFAGGSSPELLKSCFVAPAAFWRVKMWLQKQRDSRHKI